MGHEDLSDLNKLWKDQPTEKVPMTVDDIRNRGRRLETKVGWRNLREYAGAAIVLVGCVVFGWREKNVTVLTGGCVHGAGNSLHRLPPAPIRCGAIHAVRSGTEGLSRFPPGGARASAGFVSRRVAVVPAADGAWVGAHYDRARHRASRPAALRARLDRGLRSSY